MAKILLVDYNSQIRSMTKTLIETRKGWLVTEAIDSFDAITQVAKSKPDLIVLEFAMPGLNGFQVAAKVSAHAPMLPVILYTIYRFFDAMNAEAKKYGITEVVDKADGERLLEAIEKHLKKVASPADTSTG